MCNTLGKSCPDVWPGAVGAFKLADESRTPLNLQKTQKLTGETQRTQRRHKEHRRITTLAGSGSRLDRRGCLPGMTRDAPRGFRRQSGESRAAGNGEPSHGDSPLARYRPGTKTSRAAEISTLCCSVLTWKPRSSPFFLELRAVVNVRKYWLCSTISNCSRNGVKEIGVSVP